MHDDERKDNTDWERETYWNESRWEQSLRDNEKLMARYEAIWNENPHRYWDDPLDLYMKAHHGIDLGDFTPETSSTDPGDQVCLEQESKKMISDLETDTDNDIPTTASREKILDELDSISAYHLALDLSSATIDFFQKHPPDVISQESLQREFSFHILRTAADIAGGHGLGYDEHGLCGNIVKNRWALDHTREAWRLAGALIVNTQAEPDLKSLTEKLAQLENHLEQRILELRTKVWW